MKYIVRKPTLNSRAALRRSVFIRWQMQRCSAPSWLPDLSIGIARKAPFLKKKKRVVVYGLAVLHLFRVLIKQIILLVLCLIRSVFNSWYMHEKWTVYIYCKLWILIVLNIYWLIKNWNYFFINILYVTFLMFNAEINSY